MFNQFSQNVNEEDKFYLKPISSESGIPFLDDDTDCAILELEPSSHAHSLPTPLKKWKPHIPRTGFYLIGYFKDSAKCAEVVEDVLDHREKQYTNERINGLVKSCEVHLKKAGMDPNNYVSLSPSQQ